MATDACVMCRRTAVELAVGTKHDFAQLLTRPRPLLKNSTYQLCFECARRIRKQEDERAQEAIRQAERSGV